MISEDDPTPRPVKGGQSSPVEITRNRSLAIPKELRRPPPRETNSEGEPNFSSRSFQIQSVLNEMTTTGYFAGTESGLPSPVHGKGSQSLIRITSRPRWGSCPVKSVNTSLNPMTPPSGLQNTLAGGAAALPEWPLRDSSLKRIGNGRGAFQLQFY